MADTVSATVRSRIMSLIRGKDTKPEVVLRKALWNQGYRYRKNYAKLPGKPDICLTKQHICIFIDGEFWHGKGFNGEFKSKKYRSLKDQLEHSNNSSYWLGKIEKNMARDQKVNEQLKDMGWKVIRFWADDAMHRTGLCIAKLKFLESKQH